MLSASKRETVDASVASLSGLNLDQLRLQWRNQLGGIAPAHLPGWLLMRVLAYRIQAAAFGDLDRTILRRLRDDALESGDARPFAPRGPTTREGVGLKSGALLVREWSGRLERVMVLDDGYAWNGLPQPFAGRPRGSQAFHTSARSRWEECMRPCGDHARATENAVELARLAREHELPMYGAFGAFLEGWATAQGGAPGGGVADMRRGVENLRAQNVLVFDGLLKVALAEAEARSLCQEPSDASQLH